MRKQTNLVQLYARYGSLDSHKCSPLVLEPLRTPRDISNFLSLRNKDDPSYLQKPQDPAEVFKMTGGMLHFLMYNVPLHEQFRLSFLMAQAGFEVCRRQHYCLVKITC